MDKLRDHIDVQIQDHITGEIRVELEEMLWLRLFSSHFELLDNQLFEELCLPILEKFNEDFDLPRES